MIMSKDCNFKFDDYESEINFINSVSSTSKCV